MGAFRSDDGGTTWKAITEPGTRVHRLTMHPAYPDRLYMQKRGGVMRTSDAGGTGGTVYGSNDGGDSWTPIVRDLPPVNSVEVQTMA